MNGKGRYTTRWMVVLAIVLLSLCTACVKTPVKPAENTAAEDRIAEYLAPLQEEADTIFGALSEAAIGSRPEEIRIGFRTVGTDFLSGEKESLSELLQHDAPVLLVGFVSPSEKGYSDDEIQKIILEAKKRELVVDLYFNYNEDYVYQVRSDGVVIDKVTGKDGGAMREQIPYEMAETEQEKHE